MDQQIQEALSQLQKALGVKIKLAGDVLSIDGARITLPPAPQGKSSARWEQLDLRNAFPGRAHGDQREKLLYKIVQDGADADPDKLDISFYHALPDSLKRKVTEPQARLALAEAMRDEYWVTPKDQPFLIPYHATLPLSLALARKRKSADGNSHSAARYRMFRGAILPFLCWTGTGVDRGLVEDTLGIFNETDGFTVLDQLMLDAALEFGQLTTPKRASADILINRGETAGPLSVLQQCGAFCQPTLTLFQRDLRTVLGMRLPRRDKIDALTSLLSLHLALHYYRVSLVLGEEVDRAIAASNGLTAPVRGCDCSSLSTCPLAGAIRFRTGTRGYVPVRLSDACVRSYRELDGRRLLALPANIITANLAQSLWVALGGPKSDVPRMRELGLALSRDAKLQKRFDAAARALALLCVLDTDEAPEPAVAIKSVLRGPGLHALRTAVLDLRRSRLKHTSRDVVNQLAKRESGGSLLRTNGPSATFFELDEDFLFLLVKLICRDEEKPYTTFLSELREYGLAPQDESETARLAEALERLGMLSRYSDAGEASYVRHII